MKTQKKRCRCYIVMPLMASIFAIVAVKLANPACAQVENAPTNTLPSIFAAKKTFSAQYRVTVKDRAPREYYDQQIEVNSKTVKSQLANGQKTPKEAKQIIDMVNQAFKHHDDNVFSTFLAYSENSLLYKERHGSNLRVAVYMNGKTFLNDTSVVYMWDRLEHHAFLQAPPLSMNFGDLKIVKAPALPKTQAVPVTTEVRFLTPGNPSQDGDEGYRTAFLEWQTKDNAPLVTQVRFGTANYSYRKTIYSGHRRIADLWLPSKIVDTRYSATRADPNKSYATIETTYDLVACTTNVPKSEFDVDKRVEGGQLIQYDNGESVQSFHYDATKSIEKQHLAAFQMQQTLENKVKKENFLRRANGGIMLTLAGIGILIYWIINRYRAIRASS